MNGTHCVLQGAERQAEEARFRQVLVPLAAARENYLTRKFIAVSGYKHNCSDVFEFAQEYFRFLWKLVVLGMLTGRLAVLPPFNCSSPWISRNPSNRAHVDQVLTCALSGMHTLVQSSL